MVDLDALIKTAQAKLEAAEPHEVATVEYQGKGLTIFVSPLPRTQWQDMKASHPMREDAPRDARTDYNLDGIARDYPGIRVVVDGGEPDDLIRVVDGKRVTLWPALYETLPGEALDAVAYAIWGYNDHEAAGKDSAGE